PLSRPCATTVGEPQRLGTIRRRGAKGLAMLALLAAAAALLSCSTGERAPYSGGEPGGPSATSGDVTSTNGGGGGASGAEPGQAGCPCNEAGAVAECGKIISTSGDYVTCSMGHARCDGQVWGPCAGDHFFIKSAPNASSPVLGAQPLSTQVACTNTCDPA